ncbi:MAG: PKD domain-containing protein [Planctomycetaceae bacterium]|nr:PKD domain-containing protein [Planctomycetaceae bacterium]
MKKILLSVFIAVIGLCALPAKSELLVNPGFELGAPETGAWQEGWMPSNWFKWGVGGWASWKSASRESIAYTPHTGDKFYAVGAWTSGEYQNVGQIVRVNPDEVFVFSTWAMTENWGTPTGYFLIKWFDSADDQVGSDEFGTLISGSQVATWTQYTYTTTAAPAGAMWGTFQIEGDAQGTILADDVSVKLRYAANDPVPDINASVPPATAQLQWTRPAPRSSGTVTVDVWFGTSIAAMTKVVSNQAVNSWTISPALSTLSASTFYWRVDCIDESITTTGRQWQFFTNTAPVVDAGTKQNIWLESGSATASMAAVVTDDGLPNPPATVTYLWTVNSGPASVTFTPNATTLNPTATFTTAGDYVLKLTASDSVVSNEDTVKVRVFAAGQTGLIAHYMLNETSGSTATDSIGGHNGTLVNSPTWLPTGGKVGGALQLTSSLAQDVNCGGAVEDHNSPSWADLRDEITVSAWIKLPTAGWPGGNTPWTAIVTKGDSSWRLTRNDNSNTVYFYCNGLQDYGREVIGVTDVADNQWHFIAGTYDGARIALYVDGLLQNSYASSGQIAFNNADVYIGNNAEGTDNRFFSGVIDQVRIHNIGLPQDKIIEQYVADGGTTICAEYLTGDLNNDCYIDFEDFAMIAENWLKCTDITNGRCE